MNTVADVADRIVTYVLSRSRDPGEWLFHAASLCEAAELKAEHCIALPSTLAAAAWGIAKHAESTERLDALVSALDGKGGVDRSTMVSALGNVALRVALGRNGTSPREGNILHMMSVVAFDREKALGVDLDRAAQTATALWSEIRAEARRRLGYTD